MLKRTLLASAFGVSMAVSGLGLAVEAGAKTVKPTASAEEWATRPALRNVQVSPDGKKVAYRVAQTRKGEYYVEVRETGNLKKKPVKLGSSKMDITSFRWISNNQLIIDFRQQVGRQVKNQNEGTFRSKRAIMNADGSGRPVALPDDVSVMADLIDDPNHVLVQTNKMQDLTFDEMRAKGMTASAIQNPDYYTMNVKSGALRKHSASEARQVAFDQNGNRRLSSEYRPDRGQQVFSVKRVGDENWTEVFALSDSDLGGVFTPLGAHPTKPDTFYVSTNRANGGRTDKSDVYEMTMDGTMTRVWGKSNQDILSAQLSPNQMSEDKVEGFVYYDDEGKRAVKWISKAAKNRHDQLAATFPGKTVRVTSASQDGKTYVAFVQDDLSIGRFYLVTPAGVQPIGPARGLDDSQLAEQRYVEYTARDGMKIPAYITIPKNAQAPYKTIVMPHGGPNVSYRPGEFDEWSQFLASNGYLVIDPLFRGTTGLGEKHTTSGYSKWGEEMSDDMDDGVKYLVSQGLTDPDKVAMFGWSFGGYSAFAAAMRSPQIYKCTIPGAAVGDLGSQNAGFSDFRRTRRILKATYNGLNPIDNIDKVSVPMLIIHGELDQRVRLNQSQELVKKLEAAGKPHRNLVLPKADHFNDTIDYDNRVAMYKEMLDFLEKDCGM